MINLRQTLFALSSLGVSALFAGNPNSATVPRFEPNRGQFTTVKGEPAPFILLKAEGKGLSTYLTTTGLSYVFTKRVTESLEEKRKAGPKQRPFFRTKPKVVTAEMAWAHMHLEGADIRPENIVLEEEGTARYDYFLKHCPQGITGLHRYGRAIVREVYPGVDWVLYTNEHGLKYDFIVHPNGDPNDIRFVYHSEQPVSPTADGGISIPTGMGTLTEHAPVSYWKESGEQVQSGFHLTALDKHRVRIRFELPTHRVPGATLVIDPQLTWATFTHTDQLDGPMTVKTKSNGDVIMAGYGGGGFGFPVPFDTLTFNGAFTDVVFGGFLQAFSNTGVLLWSTLYSGIDLPLQLHVDANDRILLAGTAKTDFVTQPGIGSFAGAYHSNTYGGGVFESDAMIVGFTPGGQREWATFLGGGHISGVTSDATGRIFMAGSTDDGVMLDQPGTGSFAGSYYLPPADSQTYLLGLSANGALQWASGFPTMMFRNKSVATTAAGQFVMAGGGGSGAPVVANGPFSGAAQNAVDGFDDGYIAVFSNAGSQLWGTYFELGGSPNVHGLAVGTDGRLVVQATHSPDAFTPLATGVFAGAYQNSATGEGDACLIGFNAAGTVQWRTQLGGTVTEQCSTEQQLAMDACGNIYTTYEALGFGVQPNVPLLSGGCNSTFDGVYGDGDPANSYGGDMVLMRFTPNGALTWSTFHSGPWDDHRSAMTVSAQGDLYAVGESQGGGFPTLNPGNGAYYMDDATVSSDDSFILHYSPTSCEATGCAPFYATAVNTALACGGDCSATATATGINGVAPYTFSWDNGQTTAAATGLCEGEHSVTVTDSNGLSETVSIVVTAPAALEALIGSSASACNAPTGTLFMESITGGVPDFNIPFGYSLVWSTGVSDDDTLTSIAPGEYALIVTDANGCTDTATVAVAQVSQPVAQVTALDTVLTGGESTTLFASGGGTYLWSPATGLSCTTCQSPTVSPTDTTVYCVVVTDLNQCTDTACVRILTEKPCGAVFVPTAFSPNASGKNDQQCVYGDCITTMAFSIYDRWGKLIFESSDPKTCWDGTYEGKALNPAVFVFRLTATLTNGDVVEQSGNITLVR
jgi:gliding motility-associated-like protein